MQSKEYKQAIRMARTLSTDTFNPQDKAVWHHLKVAVLNTVILKKCHENALTIVKNPVIFLISFIFHSHNTEV